jgi:hypothetical protein
LLPISNIFCDTFLTELAYWVYFPCGTTPASINAEDKIRRGIGGGERERSSSN